jgi:hypothetical protein
LIALLPYFEELFHLGTGPLQHALLLGLSAKLLAQARALHDHVPPAVAVVAVTVVAVTPSLNSVQKTKTKVTVSRFLPFDIDSTNRDTIDL